MKAILFGATGMVGAGVLIECLEDERVESVLAVGRRSCGVTSPKLVELIHDDFQDFSAVREQLDGYDACFFCLGITSAGMTEEAYRRITFDITIAAATVIAEMNPGLKFCFVSGQGTDSTESGRIMWARVKGMTENRLLEMPLETYLFRPGFIQPMKGVKSKTRLYHALYVVFAPLYPILKTLFPNNMTTSVALGRAMIEVSLNGHSASVLETSAINEVAERSNAE